MFIVITIGACTNKAIYDNFQLNNRNECTKQPHSEYDACMERTNMSYEEYERKRKEDLVK